MKKLILIASLVLVSAGCNSTVSTPTTNTPTPVEQTPPSAMANWQTYSNGSYNFSFQYPPTFKFYQPTYGGLTNQIVQVQLNNSAYPKTNFDDAAVTVSTDNAKSLSACLNLNSPKNANSFKSQQTINGVQFYTNPSSGAGAGNFYAGTAYRTFDNGLCLELTETIHTSNIDNFPAGSVTAVDSKPIQQMLDGIISTFKLH